jgi:hypothetical protein
MQAIVRAQYAGRRVLRSHNVTCPGHRLSSSSLRLGLPGTAAGWTHYAPRSLRGSGRIRPGCGGGRGRSACFAPQSVERRASLFPSIYVYTCATVRSLAWHCLESGRTLSPRRLFSAAIACRQGGGMGRTDEDPVILLGGHQDLGSWESAWAAAALSFLFCPSSQPASRRRRGRVGACEFCVAGGPDETRHRSWSAPEAAIEWSSARSRRRRRRRRRRPSRPAPTPWAAALARWPTRPRLSPPFPLRLRRTALDLYVARVIRSYRIVFASAEAIEKRPPARLRMRCVARAWPFERPMSGAGEDHVHARSRHRRGARTDRLTPYVIEQSNNRARARPCFDPKDAFVWCEESIDSL